MNMQNSNWLTLVGQVLTAQTATPIYSSPDIDGAYYLIQKGDILGEVADVEQTGVINKIIWLKLYTSQPNTFRYVPVLVEYFPEWYQNQGEGFSITTPILLTGLVFTAYQSYTANTRAGKNLWGLGAAGITATLVYKWWKGLDLNPFD